MQFYRYNFWLLIIFLSIFFSGFASSQVIFRELPNYQPNLSDHSFFDITQTRNIILLNGKWKIYNADDEDKNKVTINVPSIFKGNGELIFEKEFRLSDDDIRSSTFNLVFLGLNYRADISINNFIIYRHPGGEFPFTIELSRDILRSDSVNILLVNLYYQLDSKNTFPLKQRFLFPKNFGGIIHDVYIHKSPLIHISDLDISSKINFGKKVVSLNFKSIVKNNEVLVSNILPDDIPELTLKTFIVSPDTGITFETKKYSFELGRNKDLEINQSITIKKPRLWSREEPKSYEVRLELWRGDLLIDIISRTIALFKFEVSDNALTFNGKDFKLNGVTYIPGYQSYGNLVNYEQYEDDIKLIRAAGFNAVRIAKSVPHPYILHLCEKYGLLVFIELPVGMIPEKISQDKNFVVRYRYFLSSYFHAYKKYSAVVAVGFGTSFLTSIDSHRSLLINLGGLVKDNTDWITYASFGNLNIEALENIDMYGLEIFNELLEDISDELKYLQNELGNGRVFISEATYTVNRGHTDGYVNKYSYEAQAKYFSDIIDYSHNNPLYGYFINSIMDIRGDYSSLLSGYNSENIYNIGLVSENRKKNHLSYNVVSSKLNNTEKVTIPIGSIKDDAPMVFILFGLALALLMGVLVNSGRKFREDASRALLRPYNFYADVRDQRIMSAYHTTFLAIIIIIVNALIIGNLLFYFKTNIVFEKILLSFGSPPLLEVVNYLSWHPFKAIEWISIIGLLILLLVSLLIRVASLFIRTRVYFSSIYFTVIWALLPMVFLIPLGIVLYRILAADILNVYIYITLIGFGVWILYRLLKGVYVIFDASPGSVYFYSIIFLLLLSGSVLIYFEVNNSAIQYILFIFKQYGILI